MQRSRIMGTNATRCQLKFWSIFRCALTPKWSFMQVCAGLPWHIYKPQDGKRSSHMTGILDLEMEDRSDGAMEAVWCRIQGHCYRA